MSDEKRLRTSEARPEDTLAAMAAEYAEDPEAVIAPFLVRAFDLGVAKGRRSEAAYPGCGHPEVKPGCMTCNLRAAEASPPDGGPPTRGVPDTGRLQVTKGLMTAALNAGTQRRESPKPTATSSPSEENDDEERGTRRVRQVAGRGPGRDSVGRTAGGDPSALGGGDLGGDGGALPAEPQAGVTPNACKTSGEPGGGVVASVAPSSPLPVREPEEAGATFTFTEPNACSECGNDAPFEEWRCHLHRCGTTVRAARSSGAERDESTPEEKAFWDGVHKSAELVKGQPAWTGAGINLNPKNFETYAPDAQTVPRDKHDAALITCAVAGQQCHRMCEAVRAYLTARKGQGPETYDVALARMVRTLAEIDAAVKVST
jgi:hypothetical protein